VTVDCDEREIEVQPEHEAEHADDGQEIDEDAERCLRREGLDGGDVRGDRAQESAGLLRVVVGEGEAVEVVEDAHPEVVGHPLTNALGVVVVDVARDGAEHADDHESGGCRGGDRHSVVGNPLAEQCNDPLGKRMASHRAVDHDLERPRAGQAHRGLDEQREQDDGEPPPVGAKEVADQLHRPEFRSRSLCARCSARLWRE